jgi:L-rhamnose isomerase / sugar isomerase
VLSDAREANDVVKAQEIIQDAYRNDVRPLVAEARMRAGGSLSPVEFYRSNKIREALIKERGVATVATGL